MSAFPGNPLLTKCWNLVVKGDAAKLARLLDDNPEILRKDDDAAAVLLEQAMRGAASRAKYNYVADAKQCERVLAKERACFDVLLKHGANVNARSTACLPPLLAAIEIGHPMFIVALLEAGAKKNTKGPRKNTAVIMLNERIADERHSPQRKALDRELLKLFGS